MTYHGFHSNNSFTLHKLHKGSIYLKEARTPPTVRYNAVEKHKPFLFIYGLDSRYIDKGLCHAYFGTGLLAEFQIISLYLERKLP